MNKTLMVLLVAALLALVTPSTFALDVGKLEKALNQYAAASEWMNMVMHPGMPKPWTNPQLPDKIKQLHEAQDTIRKEVASIQTKEEMAQARAIAETYKMAGGIYRDVGYQLEYLLNEREKFLATQQ